MKVLLSAYSMVVAAIFALVYSDSPRTANGLALLFVFAVLIPAVTQDWRKHKDLR